jgi:hypothetical protein
MSSMKKVLLIGFILVLLIAIPVTVFLLQQQSKTKSGATAATTISILPATQTVKVGDTVALTVKVDPTSTNLVSFVKFTINYVGTKLSVDPTNGFVVSGPLTPTKNVTYGTNSISVTLSANGNAQSVIQTPTTIGTITFKALETTDAPTQITFGSDTQVLSLGSTDQFNENVLSSANPANISIIAGVEVSPTPTVTAEPTATPQTIAPTCTSLTADTTSGTAPVSTNLTVVGSSSNSTISKVTFNFGDGQTQDITASGGIGTNAVNVLQSHSYASAGTFQAKAVLTDANNAFNNATCSVTITVAGTTTASATTTVVAAAPTATPTPIQEIAQPSAMPNSGPADLIKIGGLGGIITLIGAVILFAL